MFCRENVLPGRQELLQDDKGPAQGAAVESVGLKVNHDFVGAAAQTGHTVVLLRLNHIKIQTLMQGKGPAHPLHMELHVQHSGTGDKTDGEGQKPKLKTLLNIKSIKPQKVPGDVGVR
jgi:hypothetical protein